jgi:hypothetical protein
VERTTHSWIDADKVFANVKRFGGGCLNKEDVNGWLSGRPVLSDKLVA